MRWVALPPVLLMALMALQPALHELLPALEELQPALVRHQDASTSRVQP